MIIDLQYVDEILISHYSMTLTSRKLSLLHQNSIELWLNFKHFMSMKVHMEIFVKPKQLYSNPLLVDFSYPKNIILQYTLNLI
jgi:hypothetical protein